MLTEKNKRSILALCHWLVSICLLCSAKNIVAGEVRVVATGENWVEIAVDASDADVSLGQDFDRVDIPGWMWLYEPGAPAVPAKGVVLGVPFGARPVVTVVDADYERITNVDLMPVPETLWLGSEDHPFSREMYDPDEAIYQTSGFYPGSEAVVSHTGVLRDQRVMALSLRPVQYDPVQRVLQIARTLTLRVQFVQGATRPAVRSLGQAFEDGFTPIYEKGLLNAEQARVWRGRRTDVATKQTSNWYEPTSTYYKIRITEDGFYRLDASWFTELGIALNPGDLDLLQLFVNGSEIPLLIEDGGDGVLDAGDGVMFWGTYRRVANRDFESKYGKEQVYFLRVGSTSGLRYEQVDGAPVNNAPQMPHFLSRVHVEIDSTFQPMGFAPDAERDHWYWRRTASPSRPGGAPTDVVIPVPLIDFATEAGGEAFIRMGMHSLTLDADINPDHYAVIQIQGGPVVAEERWDGQEDFESTSIVAASALSDTTYMVLRSPGDPSYPLEPIPYVDHILFNWVAITYPRRFEAADGMLRFDPSGITQNTIAIDRFKNERIWVLNVEKNKIITNASVAQNGDGFRTTFEVAEPGDFVAVDESAIKVPTLGEQDITSDLRGFAGAEYVIVSGADFLDAAQQLADHRAGQGLSTLVVDVADVYDEFSFGQVDEEAIRGLVQYGFQFWNERPVYVLLFGRFNFDYRNLFGQPRVERHNLVPGMPFQSQNRGLSFTDEYFGRVDDDLFMDVSVGRFSVSRVFQANTVVQKTIGYDEASPARWRDQVLLMANWDEADALKFAGPSDSLATFTDAIGLENFKVYHDANTPPEPNASSQEVIRQINEGRLIVNFMGHGSAASMQKFFAGTFQQGSFNYMSQIQNRDRLPLFIGMSCLNGLYWDPRTICLAEEMTNKPNGGAVAYVSASSLAFIRINNEINLSMFQHTFEKDVLAFGQSLALAKIEELATFASSERGVIMMNLLGDPAQKIALPNGPDFALDASALTLDRTGELTTDDSVRVTLNVANWGVTPTQDVNVVLIDHNLDLGIVDTLFMAALSPFGNAEHVVVLWPLKDRPGRHSLEALVDPANAIAEGDETNNRAVIEVDVFGALSAVQVSPLESQVVTASDVVLGARSGVTDIDVTGEFEVSASGNFGGADVMRSGAVPEVGDLVVWRPSGLGAGIYRWRARMSDGQSTGPWSAVRTFVVAGAVPARQVIWQQDGAVAAATGTKRDVVVAEDGSVRRTQSPPHIRFQESDASFGADGVTGAGVLCSDGTYVYVKRFFTVQDLYPGDDRFVRIGTGFNGTVAGQNYGTVTETPVRGISATFHSDGFIYAEHSKAESILRISPVTGQIDTVAVPDKLLDLTRGLPFDAHQLITSDGEFIYNVSAGLNGVRRGGWTVRVFDPVNDWRLVREFTSEPTETGFGYLFTDGAIADGRFVYFIEFGTGLTHRVRVVDAQTGAFVEEFESDQAQTDILGGQFDWANNVIWLGQLRGNTVYRYPGQMLPEFGTLTSDRIGPANGWQALTVSMAGSGRSEVTVLGEMDVDTFVPLNGLQNLAPGTIDLSGIGSSVPQIKVQIKLFGEGLTPSPGLQTWAVTYQPLSDIGLANLKTVPTEVNELETVELQIDIQNRGPLDLALGTSIAFYSGPPALGRLIGRIAVPEDAGIGQVVPKRLVWQTAQWAGNHVIFAQLEDFQGRPLFSRRQIVAEEPVVIIPSNDRGVPTIEIVALDALGEVRAEDYLPSDPTFRIVMRDTAGIDLSSVKVSLSGTGEILEDNYESGRIQEREVTPKTLTFEYVPGALIDDRYTLDVEAVDKLGNGPAKVAMTFQISSTLAIEQALVSPNPVADTGHFTFILSRPSEVTVRVYTLAGRLVNMIQEPFARAGYNQIFWNGRDADGQMLANNTYLYTVTADDGESQVRIKDKLIVYR